MNMKFLSIFLDMNLLTSAGQYRCRAKLRANRMNYKLLSTTRNTACIFYHWTQFRWTGHNDLTHMPQLQCCTTHIYNVQHEIPKYFHSSCVRQCDNCRSQMANGLTNYQNKDVEALNRQQILPQMENSLNSSEPWVIQTGLSPSRK